MSHSKNDNAELDTDHVVKIDGEETKVGDLPQEVQDSILHFKRRSEEIRLESIQDKRNLGSQDV